jgi:hypothetical protein
MFWPLESFPYPLVHFQSVQLQMVDVHHEYVTLLQYDLLFRFPLAFDVFRSFPLGCAGGLSLT